MREIYIGILLLSRFDNLVDYLKYNSIEIMMYNLRSIHRQRYLVHNTPLGTSTKFLEFANNIHQIVSYRSLLNLGKSNPRTENINCYEYSYYNPNLGQNFSLNTKVCS